MVNPTSTPSPPAPTQALFDDLVAAGFSVVMLDAELFCEHEAVRVRAYLALLDAWHKGREPYMPTMPTCLHAYADESQW